MRFKTDFIDKDYMELCWYQVRGIGTILAVLLAMAFSFMISSLLESLLALIILLAVLNPITHIAVRRYIKKRAQRRFIAFNVSSELVLDITEKGIVQMANSGETELLWEDVFMVGESKKSYYVFLTKRKAFYFPKRSFDTPECEKEFISILRKHVPGEKIKLKSR